MKLPDNVAFGRCRHGHMLYLPTDAYVGRSIQSYGEFSPLECQMLCGLVNEGDKVIDVGANIGCITVPLALKVGAEGLVLAYEAQPVIGRLLRANVGLAGLENVIVFDKAVSDQDGKLVFPDMDYNATNNFGGVGALHGAPDDVGGTITVEATTLDKVRLKEVALIKIDVEGMELQVLAGGERLIEASRPVLYVENDREQNSPALIDWLLSHKYDCYWDLPPLYSPRNYLRNPINNWPNVSSINLLCFPAEQNMVVNGLRKVQSTSDWYR